MKLVSADIPVSLSRNMSCLIVCVAAGLCSSVSYAQNFIDIKIVASGMSVHEDEDTVLAVSSQMHELHIRINTDLPPITEFPSSTGFDAELISWRFYDNELADQGFVGFSGVPFTLGPDPEPEMLTDQALANTNANLIVRANRWTINAGGELKGLDSDFSNKGRVLLSFDVRSPYPDFSVGIDTLPDDPALYTVFIDPGIPAPDQSNADQPSSGQSSLDSLGQGPLVELNAGIGDFELIAQWPLRSPEPAATIDTLIDSTPSNIAWSAQYTQGPECLVDLNNDGVLDFFDVSAFLQLFAVGCP